MPLRFSKEPCETPIKSRINKKDFIAKHSPIYSVNYSFLPKQQRNAKLLEAWRKLFRSKKAKHDRGVEGRKANSKSEMVESKVEEKDSGASHESPELCPLTEGVVKISVSSKSDSFLEDKATTFIEYFENNLSLGVMVWINKKSYLKMHNGDQVEWSSYLQSRSLKTSYEAENLLDLC